MEALQQTVAALARLRLDTFGPDDPIDMSAVVCLRDEADDRETIYFVVPVARGETLEDAGVTVQTITPGSPLGEALMGKTTDDDVELELPKRSLEAAIDWVALRCGSCCPRAELQATSKQMVIDLYMPRVNQLGFGAASYKHFSRLTAHAL